MLNSNISAALNLYLFLFDGYLSQPFDQNIPIVVGKYTTACLFSTKYFIRLIATIIMAAVRILAA
jgi:hypothetical protein